MKIALCDDDITELQKTKTVIEDYIEQKNTTRTITLITFTNPDDLLCHITRFDGFDLLILDIIMPGMNGIQLASEIRSKNTECKIIFLTSSPEYAIKSYQVNAFHYLMKPFSRDVLHSLLDKVIAQMEKETSTSFVIKQPGKLTRIQIHTIHFIECIKHIIYFHLQDGSVLSCYGTLNEFHETLLSDKRFIRCHKSFIVNIEAVTSISKKDFIMYDKTLIPISRHSYQQVKSAYIDYFFDERNESI